MAAGEGGNAPPKWQQVSSAAAELMCGMQVFSPASTLIAVALATSGRPWQTPRSLFVVRLSDGATQTFELKDLRGPDVEQPHTTQQSLASRTDSALSAVTSQA